MVAFIALKSEIGYDFGVLLQLSLWFYWHLVCPIQMLVFRHWLEGVSKRVRFWFSFVFYVILDLFIWIWQLYLIATVSNQIKAVMKLTFGRR